jgi:magnesium-transporting ATPase (P-type)
MVLCPDVFQGNWTAVQNIAELGEKVAKQATELYQQVSMFVCVLSGLMILLCVSFVSYGLYRFCILLYVPTHIYVCI